MGEAKPEIVVIGGCGHVGLPLCLAFAKTGRRVVAMDTDAEKVALVMRGRMPFQDKGADEALSETLASGRLSCTTDASVVTHCETVISVTGTPLDEHSNPQFSVVTDIIEDYSPLLRSGQLLILRSTVYPGTTERVCRLMEERGLALDVAFCPERVAEGRALEEIGSLPQIVSGCTENAVIRARDLFATVCPKTIILEPIAAELAKLFTNAWRYAMFGLANQFFMIANDHGMDFYRIRDAIMDEYPRAGAFEAAGFAAGPCLLKDTAQLQAFHTNTFLMGQAATMVNEGFPNYLVRRMASRYPLRDRVVGILGMTFKGESDDSRDSLAFKLRKILATECREVLCSDPYLKSSWLLDAEEVVRRGDIFVIGAPHTAYRTLNFRKKQVIDVWNIVPGRMKAI